MKRLTLGKFPEVGLADARTRARDALNKVANGVDPQQHKQIERLADTFGELVDTLLKSTPTRSVQDVRTAAF